MPFPSQEEHLHPPPQPLPNIATTKGLIKGIDRAMICQGWRIATGNDFAFQTSSLAIAVGEKLHFIDGPTSWTESTMGGIRFFGKFAKPLFCFEKLELQKETMCLYTYTNDICIIYIYIIYINTILRVMFSVHIYIYIYIAWWLLCQWLGLASHPLGGWQQNEGGVVSSWVLTGWIGTMNHGQLGGSWRGDHN